MNDARQNARLDCAATSWCASLDLINYMNPPACRVRCQDVELEPLEDWNV
jgi:hypothetical protein